MSAVAIALSPPWSATAELDENGCNVYFKLFHDSGGTEDKALEAQGFVKWDGCSNWSTGPDYLHFCDAAAERAFAEVLVTLRREAELLMGDKAQFSDSQPMGRTTATLTKMTIGGMSVTIRPAPAIGGPADNTGRCPVCSMMPHVHGCTSKKCGAPVQMGVLTDWELRDGAGESLLSATNSGTLSAPSPYVRELVALAPELDRLVREHQYGFEDGGGNPVCPECRRSPHGEECQLGTVLDRLDAARKAERDG